MKITLLEPISYCNGVENAINTLETAISENTNKQIFVYGEIIHNLFIIRKYMSEGVIFIDKNVLLGLNIEVKGSGPFLVSSELISVSL